MKALIIHVASAGEVICSTPLIRILKTQLDDIQLYYVTSTKGASALSENPYLNKVYTMDNGYLKLWIEIRKQKFDMIVDLDASPLSYGLSMLNGAQVYRMHRKKVAKWFRNRINPDAEPPPHLAIQYMNVVALAKVKPDDLQLDFFIPYKDIVPMDWLPQSFQKGYVVFCLPVQYATRRLPVKRMIELCDRINKPVLLLGTKEDAIAGEQIEVFFERKENSTEWEEGLKELNKKAIVYNSCGKFNFHQMASIVKQAKYVFTFDNDFIPIASAFRKEVFSIWGNTVLQSGRYPYQTKFTVFENNKLSCRPCSDKGYAQCPLKHFKCMNEIVFDFYIA